ncbi:hypothetical protein FE810_15840 [Thalassotalea litorea]|uniref:DUF861 domain-containing protein n=1 Tax=Thalassotalea litorea TaxID=2020715 RepID=A0A5R9IBR9_9GAMM|nr:hypothetical protein [Thalassotalea litorea]TLU61055.1 hypothetical protein FE810_15840 [Thalassotalea litorea]
MANAIYTYPTQIETLAEEADVLSAEMFESALPVQHTREFFSDAQRGIYVGLWDTTSMRETAGPYPMEEFMVVLQGKADIALSSGNVRQVQTDEGFVIPHGVDCQWQQQGYLKKLFVIVENPDICPVNENAKEICIFGPEHANQTYQNNATSFVVYPLPEYKTINHQDNCASLAVVYCHFGAVTYESASQSADSVMHHCRSLEVMIIENFSSQNLSFDGNSSGFIVLIHDSRKAKD